jgi:hypothetical protein
MALPTPIRSHTRPSSRTACSSGRRWRARRVQPTTRITRLSPPLHRPPPRRQAPGRLLPLASRAPKLAPLLHFAEALACRCQGGRYKDGQPRASCCRRHNSFTNYCRQTVWRVLGRVLSQTRSSLPKASSSTSSIDVDKVRKVLEGKAVLRVVDVDSNITQLEEGMKAVSLVSGRKSPSLKRSASSNASVETLEEGLKSMNLNHAGRKPRSVPLPLSLVSSASR